MKFIILKINSLVQLKSEEKLNKKKNNSNFMCYNKNYPLKQILNCRKLRVSVNTQEL